MAKDRDELLVRVLGLGRDLHLGECIQKIGEAFPLLRGLKSFLPSIHHELGLSGQLPTVGFQLNYGTGLNDGLGQLVLPDRFQGFLGVVFHVGPVES